MQCELFDFLPHPLRKEQIEKLKKKGINKAIRFPAAYFTVLRSMQDKEKDWQSYDLLWVNCCIIDNRGMIIKAAPDFLIENAKQVLTKYEQEFEVIEL